MDEMIRERMEACANHPEKQQIFYLEKMLIEAGYPYFFNFWDDLGHMLDGGADGDPESIDWDSYKFLIEVGQLAGYELPQISISFSTGRNHTLLELLDMRPAGDEENVTAEDGELSVDLTAEECMKIIEIFFETME